MTSVQIHLERVVQQMTDKAPVPLTDFSLHQLENGRTISTRERVIQEVCSARRRARLKLNSTVPQVLAPALRVPTDDEFFADAEHTKPDIAFLKDHFFREGRLTEDQALFIFDKATAILRAEPNVLDLEAPLTSACIAAVLVAC